MAVGEGLITGQEGMSGTPGGFPLPETPVADTSMLATAPVPVIPQAVPLIQVSPLQAVTGSAAVPLPGFTTSAVPLSGGGYVATAEGPGFVAVAQGVSDVTGTEEGVATGVAAVTDAAGNVTYFTTSMKPLGEYTVY